MCALNGDDDTCITFFNSKGTIKLYGDPIEKVELLHDFENLALTT